MKKASATILIVVMLLLCIPIPYYEDNSDVICKQGVGCHGESSWKWGSPAIAYIYVIVVQKGGNEVRNIVCSVKNCQKFVDFPNPNRKVPLPVVITTPQKNSAITSPVKIVGTAPKGWTFEGVIQVYVEDNQYKVIGGGPVYTAESNNENQVSFETEISHIAEADTGFITVKNDNPSGLPENDKVFRLPVIFTK